MGRTESAPKTNFTTFLGEQSSQAAESFATSSASILCPVEENVVVSDSYAMYRGDLSTDICQLPELWFSWTIPVTTSRIA